MNRFEKNSDYKAALAGAAFFIPPGAGCLRISGEDRMDFIQRQTTNDVRRLLPGKALLTVLTSSSARILDVLTLLAEADAFIALTLPSHATQTASYLKSRIFFKDQVTVNDLSDQYFLLEIEGPNAASVLKNLSLAVPTTQWEETENQFESAPLRLLAKPGLAGLGFQLVLPTSSQDALEKALQSSGVAQLSPQVRDILRVEAGIPGVPHELNQEYTPLEVGLDYAVAQDKGCYTGQEVIARQISYDKVTRQIAGLRLKTLAHPGDLLFAGERSVGMVTSSAMSPRYGAIALGIVRRPHYQPGTLLEVMHNEEKIKAKVTNLPF